MLQPLVASARATRARGMDTCARHGCARGHSLLRSNLLLRHLYALLFAESAVYIGHHAAGRFAALATSAAARTRARRAATAVVVAVAQTTGGYAMHRQCRERRDNERNHNR